MFPLPSRRDGSDLIDDGPPAGILKPLEAVSELAPCLVELAKSNEDRCRMVCLSTARRARNPLRFLKDFSHSAQVMHCIETQFRPVLNPGQGA